MVRAMFAVARELQPAIIFIGRCFNKKIDHNDKGISLHKLLYRCFLSLVFS